MNFNTLLYGQKSTILISLKPTGKIKKIKSLKLFLFLYNLKKNGYVIANLPFILTFTSKELDTVIDYIENTIDSQKKKGFLLRKTFGNSKELEDYTEEEWEMIFAQYSIRYNWEKIFIFLFDKNPENVIKDYSKNINSKKISKLNLDKNLKEITLWSMEDAKAFIKDLLESKTVLKEESLLMIKTFMKEYTPEFMDVLKSSKIEIKTTTIAILKIAKELNLNLDMFKNLNDVLRYVINVYTDTPIEGQFTKKQLRELKLKISTSDRKYLLNQIEKIIKNKGVKNTVEDMYMYENFWKVLTRYLRVSNKEKMKRKWPNYIKTLNLFHEEDKSWTFNSRFEKAKFKRNYEEAMKIAAERPGFLLRNLFEFLRMTKGTKIPKIKREKKSLGVTNKIFNNTFLKDNLEKINENNNINSKILKNVKPKNEVVKDAKNYINSKEFKEVLSKNLNIRLAWQIIEELNNEELYQERYKRKVQNIEIEYEIPLPGLDRKMTNILKDTLLTHILNNKKEYIEKLGKVFIDDSINNYKIDFSGANDYSFTLSGKYITPGTKLSLDDLLNNVDIEEPLMRVGIMWRSSKGHNVSVDIDHSIFIDDKKVYYNNPILKSNFGDYLIATSSGDIVSCGDDKSLFSSEIVDIDLKLAKKDGYKKIVTFANNFSNNQSMGLSAGLETYMFISFIDKKDRVIKNNQIFVSLDQTDYAIAVDPMGKEGRKFRNLYGFGIDLEKGIVTIMLQPVKSKSNYFSNIENVEKSPDEILAEFEKKPSYKNILDKLIENKSPILNDNVDTVITLNKNKYKNNNNNIKVLDLMTESEKIKNLIF